MDLFSILAGLLVTGSVVLYVLHPVVTGRSAPMGRSGEETTETESKKRVALLGLRDVEYDYVSGKLDESDYHALRGELGRQALQAMEAERRELEERASGGGLGVIPPGDLDALEREIAAVREAIRGGTLCRECGRANGPGSRFCGGCGSGLPETASGREGGEGRSGP